MPELLADADGCLKFADELAVRHVVCSVPWVRDASQLKPDPAAGRFAIFFAAVAALTLDDWKWNADLHLLRLTDPDLVKMEFDCGWAAVAGENPAGYLTDYPERFRRLHIRDFEPGFAPSTGMWMTTPELLGPAVPAVVGTGIMNYEALLPAARAAGVETCYVERDPFYRPAPMLDLVAADYKGLSNVVY